VLDQLARRVLEGEFGEGDTVRIDAVGGELQFEVQELSRAASGPSRNETNG
jgi:hypothetical protein